MEPTERQAVTENPVESAGKDRARGGAREAGREELVAECRAYLAALKRSPATIAATVQPLKPFFAFLDRRASAKPGEDGRGLDVRALRRADAAAYRGELTAAGRSPHTVDGYLRAVKRFYAWLEKTGRVLLNPLDGLPLPRVKDALPRAVLTRSEVKRLLDAPDTSLPVGVRDKAMLELLYSTGLRLAELCALTVYDADVINGFLRVNEGKGRKGRVVPMGRKASEYVKEYLRRVRGRLTERNRDERALFVGERGRRIHPLIVERLVRSYARAAGIRKRTTPHTLRHTCGTHLLAGGADVAHVQRLLGHARITTTQIYTRVARPDLKRTHARTHPASSWKDYAGTSPRAVHET